jgi:hypothetical protein
VVDVALEFEVAFVVEVALEIVFEVGVGRLTNRAVFSKLDTLFTATP